MTIKEKCFVILKQLGGRATEKKLAEKYIEIYPDYAKNYSNTKTSSEQKIRGTINKILYIDKSHDEIKIDTTKLHTNII